MVYVCVEYQIYMVSSQYLRVFKTSSVCTLGTVHTDSLMWLHVSLISPGAGDQKTTDLLI